MHASGVHATVAGVLLGFAVPVIRPQAGPGPRPGRVAEHFEHRFRPISAGVAVPVFALFAAGVAVGGSRAWGGGHRSGRGGHHAGLVSASRSGSLGATWLRRSSPGPAWTQELAWLDVIGVAMLAGIGFTVSLLIGDLAFGGGSDADDHVKIAVLAGSVLAALLAAVFCGCATAGTAPCARKSKWTPITMGSRTSTNGTDQNNSAAAATAA